MSNGGILVLRPVRAVGSWLDAADPAAIRRWQGARATLAAVSTWLTLRVLSSVSSGHAQPGPVLFGVVICFVGAMVIADPNRLDRLVTMAAACLAANAVVVLSAILHDLPGLRYLVLLVLMFLSFAVRRFGLRAGEVALVATMTMYFASSSGASIHDVGWFVIAVTVGFGLVVLWQFVLLPINSARSLERAALAFYRRAGDLVGEASLRVRFLGGRMTLLRPSKLERKLDQIGLCRRVMESQFPGSLAPRGWTRDELEKLQLAFYSAEQGLAQMVDALSHEDGGSSIPSGIADGVANTLDSLAAALASGATPDVMRELAASAAALRHDFGSVLSLDDGDAQHRSIQQIQAISLARGAQRVAQSIGRARELALVATTSRPAYHVDEPHARAGLRPGIAPALIRVIGNIRLRPATVLGLQAVAATSLAMFVGSLLGLEHINWIFWTAFVVIAGSAGESLRRVLLRIAGTTAGALVGVALALALPNGTTVVAAVTTVSLFMTIYFAPVSYPLMVFWLNLGFVMVFTQLGAGEFDLLRQRPFATAVGGLVAALVTVVVFPVRLKDRFRASLGGYLGTLDEATTASVATLCGDREQPGAEASAARANAAYRAMQQAMSAAVFEGNPFSRTETSLSTKVLEVAAVDAAFNRVVRTMTDEGTVTSTDSRIPLLAHVVDRIHDDVAGLRSVLAGGSARLDPSLFDLSGESMKTALDASPQRGSTEQHPSTERTMARADGPVLTLAALHQSLIQLAGALGATIAPSAVAGWADQPPSAD